MTALGCTYGQGFYFSIPLSARTMSWRRSLPIGSRGDRRETARPKSRRAQPPGRSRGEQPGCLSHLAQSSGARPDEEDPVVRVVDRDGPQADILQEREPRLLREEALRCAGRGGRGPCRRRRGSGSRTRPGRSYRTGRGRSPTRGSGGPVPAGRRPGRAVLATMVGGGLEASRGRGRARRRRRRPVAGARPRSTSAARRSASVVM